MERPEQTFGRSFGCSCYIGTAEHVVFGLEACGILRGSAKLEVHCPTPLRPFRPCRLSDSFLTIRVHYRQLDFWARQKIQEKIGFEAKTGKLD